MSRERGPLAVVAVVADGVAVVVSDCCSRDAWRAVDAAMDTAQSTGSDINLLWRHSRDQAEDIFNGG